MELQQILIVDDSAVVRHLVRAVLDRAGYTVWAAASGEEALDLLAKKGLPHLAIVDINMPPGMDGFAFCRQMQAFSDVPVIMLSGEGGEATVVAGLEQHAEDYIVKPADGPLRAAELIARVRTVLNRMGDYGYTLEPVVAVDDRLQIDFAGRRALVDQRPVSLTPTETKLLYLLMRHAGHTLTSDYLLRRLYPLDEAFEERLHTHVYRLRRKIEDNPREPVYVISEWGQGYSFPVRAASLSGAGPAR